MPTPNDLKRAIQIVDDLFDELKRCSDREDADPPDFQGLQEVLYTLEEVQSVHEQLDKFDVPRQHSELGELNLFARVHWLAVNLMCAHRPEIRKDFYGGVYQPKTDQPRLLERGQKYRHRGDTAEFRVRRQTDDRPWNEIPLHGDLLVDTFSVPPSEAAQIVAQYLADNTPLCREVRWNWRSSLQGHYARPTLNSSCSSPRL